MWAPATLEGNFNANRHGHRQTRVENITCLKALMISIRATEGEREGSVARFNKIKLVVSDF